jgi:hypothetical protein
MPAGGTMLVLPFARPGRFHTSKTVFQILKRVHAPHARRGHLAMREPFKHSMRVHRELIPEFAGEKKVEK